MANGTPRADRMSARFDLDKLFGLGGADVLTSTNWNDTYLDGGRGNDRLTSVFDMGILPEDEDFEVVMTQVGGVGNDTLRATLTGSTTTDGDITARLNLAAGAGDDHVLVMLGGSVWYVQPRISIWGGPGNDVIRSVENLNTIMSAIVQTFRGGSGDDDIEVRTSGNVPYVTNRLFGDAGNDRIYAEAIGYENGGSTEANALNVISGGAGNDEIRAMASGLTNQDNSSVGTNIISGDAGDDRIYADAWRENELRGGDGHDYITATLTEDESTAADVSRTWIDGGSGNDVLVADARSTSWDYADWDVVPRITNHLIGGDGNDQINASAFAARWGDERSIRNELLGGAGDDDIVGEIVNGSLGANRMFGHAGNDRLQSVGGDGNLLHGGKGRDVLIGGEGGDTFTGAAGPDTFVFGTGPGGRDVITDFTADDRIALVGLDDTGAPGLYDDFVAAVASVEQAAAGAPVEVGFRDGGTVAITAAGVAGPIDSIDDFLRPGQIVAADLFGV